MSGTTRRPTIALLVLLACLALLAPGLSPTARSTATDAAWTDRELVGATLQMRAARDCAARDRYSARTEAALLRGQVGAVPLTTVAGLRGLTVHHPGTPGAGAVPDPTTALPAGTDAFRDPLGASAVAGLVAADLSGVVQLTVPAQAAGVQQQYGRASSDGEAHAAAGAVTDSGALLVGSSQAGAGTLPGPASIDLAALAPGTAGLAGVRLRVGAVASGARLDGCLRDEGLAGPVREYGVASLQAEALSPPVAALTATTTTAVATTQAAVTTLQQTLAAVLLGELSLLGAVTTSATIGVDLQQAVAPLLQARRSDGVVTVDLAAGTVSVDLAALTAAAGGLDGRAPGTVLALDAASTADVTARTEALLRTWVDDVVATVDTALRQAPVDVRATVKVPLLPDATVRVSGTLGQLAGGTATVSALGLTLPPTALGRLGAATQASLFAPATGAVATLRTTLQAALPAVTDRTAGVVTALGTALRLTVNVHHDDPAAGRWGVTALRVQVLAGSGTGNRVDLATAVVGPVTERP